MNVYSTVTILPRPPTQIPNQEKSDNTSVAHLLSSLGLGGGQEDKSPECKIHVQSWYLKAMF